MDVQGFGDTFATGFYQTATSGFGAGSMNGTARSQSFIANKAGSYEVGSGSMERM